MLIDILCTFVLVLIAVQLFGGLTKATLSESFFVTAKSTAMIFHRVGGCFLQRVSSRYSNAVGTDGVVHTTRVQSLDGGLVQGDIPQLFDAQFTRLYDASTAHMGTLAQNQIIAILNKTTPDMVQQTKNTVATGRVLPADMLRELGIRGANEAALNRINIEQTAIWFGILVLIVVEVGLITPPMEMNLFTINAMNRATPMIETYKAVLFLSFPTCFGLFCWCCFRRSHCSFCRGSKMTADRIHYPHRLQSNKRVSF